MRNYRSENSHVFLPSRRSTFSLCISSHFLLPILKCTSTPLMSYLTLTDFWFSGSSHYVIFAKSRGKHCTTISYINRPTINVYKLQYVASVGSGICICRLYVYVWSVPLAKNIFFLNIKIVRIPSFRTKRSLSG